MDASLLKFLFLHYYVVYFHRIIRDIVRTLDIAVNKLKENTLIFTDSLVSVRSIELRTMHQHQKYTRKNSSHSSNDYDRLFIPEHSDLGLNNPLQRNHATSHLYRICPYRLMISRTTCVL